MPVEFFTNMANKFQVLLITFFVGCFQLFGQDLLIFINGYRGPKHNSELPDNQLNLKDPTGYWYHLDDTIINRFTSTTAVYFDAHHPLSTSTHRTKLRVAKSYLFSRFCWLRKDSRWVLNKEINANGFQERVENGRLAALELKKYLLTHPTNQLHFVCHSMGYAYMLGMIDVLAEENSFGKALILSPEGANTQGRDWSLFEEVWQYGARADDPKANPIFWQDGIAPQQPIVGIDQLPPSTTGGRVYIPESYPRNKLGFIKSHHLAYYQWFDLIQPSDFGYFKQ